MIEYNPPALPSRTDSVYEQDLARLRAQEAIIAQRVFEAEEKDRLEKERKQKWHEDVQRRRDEQAKQREENHRLRIERQRQKEAARVLAEQNRAIALRVKEDKQRAQQRAKEEQRLRQQRAKDELRKQVEASRRSVVMSEFLRLVPELNTAVQTSEKTDPLASAVRAAVVELGRRL